MLLEKVAGLVEHYRELEQLLSQAEVIADQERFQKYAKAHADLSEIVAKYEKYQGVSKELTEARALLKEKLDSEMRELVQQEIEDLSTQQAELEKELRLLLLPKDPNDEKNVIVEIRAGTGGEEAALFAGDLFRMYARYVERLHWRIEMMSENPTELGGFKEVIFMVVGKGAYSKMKYESGVHRVQRVPTTEAGGRIHTSAATVAVLPEAEEVELAINPNDLRVDVYRSSGHGGQSVNTTDSAVRITHLPTGMVVTCQDEKSQLKNKEKAMKILRSRLLAQIEAEKQAEQEAARRSMVGSGDRSERIRTYNFPQNRVTDHRIGLTLHKLDNILDGDLEEMISALLAADQTEKLQATGL